MTRNSVKTKTVLFFSFALLASQAQAGIFGFLRGIPDGPPPLFSPEQVVEIEKAIMPLAPVGPNCQPTFVPGNDGLFRRTDYCHKANPAEPKGFLELGYDVPATFLVGYTPADVLARWDGFQSRAPVFLGSRVEVPAEMLKRLNLDAASVWESLLQCAERDPERARELYRTGVFACQDEAFIRSTLSDLRANLAILAGSVELAAFLDPSRIDEKERELDERYYQTLREGVSQDPLAAILASQKYSNEKHEILKLRMKAGTPEMIEYLGKYLPRMPRMHPLLVQLMFEEVLSIMSPDEKPKAAAKRFKNERKQQLYLLQMMFWIHSIEDRVCAPMGLWPSANRVAMETLGDVGVEVINALGGPKRQVVRNYHFVDCPMGRSVMPRADERQDYLLASQRTKLVMRLDDVYTQGRFNIWRELLEVRARYTSANGK